VNNLRRVSSYTSAFSQIAVCVVERLWKLRCPSKLLQEQLSTFLYVTQAFLSFAAHTTMLSFLTATRPLVCPLYFVSGHQLMPL